MKDMDTLELEGMEFLACHGCLEHEKKSENLFVVDFRADLDMSRAAVSDLLGDTLDYGKIYGIVAEVIKGGHCDLLERLAGKIADKISETFPCLENFSVRVSKQRPPVGGTAAWSRVTIRRGKK